MPRLSSFGQLSARGFGEGLTKARAALSYTFSANTANASLNLSSLSGYEAGFSDITVTVNNGVYLYSTDVANAGLTFTGGTTGDTLTLVNNGYIMGMGGEGGSQRNSAFYWNGRPGGDAIQLSINTTINNTNASAYIGGGGGGGGSGDAAAGGGGAGGALGGRYVQSGLNAPGGAGGSIGASGSNGTTSSIAGCCGPVYVASGGGGGRIFPGTGGTAVSGITGGRGGGSGGSGGARNSTSGVGGSSNASGGNSSDPQSGAGGGGWGASGGNSSYSSGSGGKAVNLNGKTVTWTSGNTTRVYGAVS